MALKKLKQVVADLYIAEERLWLNAAGDKLVKEGDEEATVLFCTPGSHISAADAEKFGLVEKKKKGAK